MFGPLGGFEILVLVALGLLIFGPRRLPEIGRTMGRAMSEFRKAATELRTSIEREIDLEEVKKTTRALQSDMREGLESIDPTRAQEEPRTIHRSRGPGEGAPRERDDRRGDGGPEPDGGRKERSPGSDSDDR